MNSGPLMFLGFLLSLSLSFWGMILAPQLQIGREEQVESADQTKALYPVLRPGLAQQGAQVYAVNGCAECHTLQVRPEALGADLERGWGRRRSVARDYLYDYPVQLGRLRLGPDLSNVGFRQTNVLWHLEHLYDPPSKVEGSVMPAYRYLFEKHEAGKRLAEPLRVVKTFEDGSELLAKPEAEALAAYLVSLQSDVSLMEAPLPPPETNAAPEGATNTVDSTNAPTTPSAPGQ